MQMSCSLAAFSIFCTRGRISRWWAMLNLLCRAVYPSRDANPFCMSIIINAVCLGSMTSSRDSYTIFP